MLTWTLRVLILSFGLIYYFLLSSSVLYYSLSCLFICLEAHALGEMALEAMLLVYLNKSYREEKSRWLQRHNKSDGGAHQALEGLVISRESPTWTGGSEIFHASPPGLTQRAGSSFCVPCLGLVFWVSCCGRAGKSRIEEYRKRIAEYSHQARVSRSCVLFVRRSLHKGCYKCNREISWEDSAVF